MSMECKRQELDISCDMYCGLKIILPVFSVQKYSESVEKMLLCVFKPKIIKENKHDTLKGMFIILHLAVGHDKKNSRKDASNG